MLLYGQGGTDVDYIFTVRNKNPGLAVLEMCTHGYGCHNQIIFCTGALNP